jgi:hypothetical protein
MPTATTTITKKSRTTQKSFLPLSSVTATPESTESGKECSMAQTSKAATLHSLYNRAARAFVLRDIALTYSLLQSGFSLLNPPAVVPDSLSEHRRKWDILRITFESTVYTSPPSSTESLPETLRSNLMESPQALATSIYSRSLALFTPSNEGFSKTVLNAAYLPYQVISTLVYCTLKIDAPDVGRVVIEDWLARREPHYSLEPPEKLEGGGYDKTLELYTLHILPKLEQWDYAKEFLEYESELTSQRREVRVCFKLNDLEYFFPKKMLYSTSGHLSTLCILKQWLLVNHLRQYHYRLQPQHGPVHHPHLVHLHLLLYPTHLQIQLFLQPIAVLRNPLL